MLNELLAHAMVAERYALVDRLAGATRHQRPSRRPRWASRPTLRRVALSDHGRRSVTCA
jgi:hypothetical protein